jgi:hypothetical protein
MAASSGGAVELRWQDNSGDETVMFVERSADGGATFQAIAALPANTTSYTDVPPEAGTVYKYRVRAGNASGQSAASIGDAGRRATRNPYTVMHAVDAESVVGPVFRSPYEIGLPYGSHIAFLGVDFGSTGATAVAMRVAAPFASQGGRLELRLDDPSGPLIGSVVIQSGGSYSAYDVLYAVVSGAAGVHDVCIVPADPSSNANIDWVMFMP